MACELCGRAVHRDGLCFAHFVKTINFGGLRRLRAEREANTTQAELARETIAAAKASGREIDRAR